MARINASAHGRRFTIRDRATRDCAGFTLPETLMAAAVTIVMIGAIVPFLWIAFGHLGGQSDRVGSLDQDRVAFDDLTRLIREARAVEPINPSPSSAPGEVVAQVLAVTTGDPARDPIILDCSQPGTSPDRYSCVRTEADGSAKRLIDGITDPETFTVVPDRNFIAVALQLSPRGQENPVSLEGGVSLRLAGATG
jgi:hypothetical protein